MVHGDRFVYQSNPEFGLAACALYQRSEFHDIQRLHETPLLAIVSETSNEVSVFLSQVPKMGFQEKAKHAPTAQPFNPKAMGGS